MANINESYDKSSDVEDIEMTITNKEEITKCYKYEEALDITGHGAYNKGLLMVCFVVITAMGIDIFGLGIIVTSATCDLHMTLKEISILSSMPFIGIIIMSYPWGYISDTRGRKLALLWAMGGSFACAVLSSFAPNWKVLAALRLIGSALSSAAESATYALLGECCVIRERAKYLLLITSALMLTPTIYYVLGYLIMKLDFSVPLGVIVYRPWRLLTLLMALPLGIGGFMLFYYNESPKFLANVGQKDEALDVLKRIYVANGGEATEFPIKELYVEDENSKGEVIYSLRSLWIQIAPLFKPPLLWKTMLLYYLTFVCYIGNNSFAIILPTIFNKFFTSYANSSTGNGFCDLFSMSSSSENNQVITDSSECKNTVSDNTILAGCVHGLSFFVLNALISQCAGKRKVLTIILLVVAAAAGVGVDSTGEPLSGLVLFYIYLTTAMIFGVISSYYVDLYPTSYRGMVGCLGMMIARISSFAGINIVGNTISKHCSSTLYGASAVVLSGAVAASFLPSDDLQLTI